MEGPCLNRNGMLLPPPLPPLLAFWEESGGKNGAISVGARPSILCRIQGGYRSYAVADMGMAIFAVTSPALQYTGRAIFAGKRGAGAALTIILCSQLRFAAMPLTIQAFSKSIEYLGCLLIRFPLLLQKRERQRHIK